MVLGNRGGGGLRRADRARRLQPAGGALLWRDAPPSGHHDHLLDDDHLVADVPIGLQCGTASARISPRLRAPLLQRGVFSAWCGLREFIPYAFGYMMAAAKVGTGIVAELGAMRISDEIDALEVMGVDSMTFLCATRLLAAWMVLPFIVTPSPDWGGLSSPPPRPGRGATGRVRLLRGGYLLIFWQFQNPPDFLYSTIKAMCMATAIVLVGCYYGYKPAAAPSGLAPRRPGRWSSTWCSCMSSGCSGRRSFGVPTRALRSGARVSRGTHRLFTAPPALHPRLVSYSLRDTGTSGRALYALWRFYRCFWACRRK